MYKHTHWYMDDLSSPSPVLPVTHDHLHAFSRLLHRKEGRQPRRKEGRETKPSPESRNVFEETELELELEEDEDELEIEDWHLVVHAVAQLQKQHEEFAEVTARMELEHSIEEAFSLLRAINTAYGWEPGEPAVVDRMFGTNTRAALASALDAGVIDFRTQAMINTIRSVGRGAQAGRSKLAMISAVRNLVGGITSSEARLIADAKRIGSDEFVTMVHDADKLSQARKVSESHHVGPHPHHHLENGTGVSIADGRTRSLHDDN